MTINYNNELDDDYNPYCDECNSCGESGCCPDTKCKYLKSYIVEYCKDKIIDETRIDYIKALKDLMNHVKA